MEKSLTDSKQNDNTLAEVFDAKSVAVVGASVDPGKSGHQILKSLLDHGFRGQIFAINPKEREILGIACHSSILDVPSPIDLLVITVPAPQALAVMEQAAQRGDIKGAVVVSAGFAETAVPEWVEGERRLVQMARSAGIRIIGPNCNGIINCETHLNTSFAPGLTFNRGALGYISQSGATGGALLMMAAKQPKPLGYSKWGHVGNMSDVSNVELIEMFGSDPSIDVIVLYLEGVHDGRKLLDAASKITPKKPIVLFKVGRTAAGAVATMSHTATLAGSDAIYDGAFKQCGIVRMNSMEEVIDGAKALSMLPRVAGNRVAVLTQTGGSGIICIDQISRDGVLQLASFSEATKEKLVNILPRMAVVGKPEGYVDLTAAASTQQFCDALNIAIADPGVDSVILLILPPSFQPPLEMAVGIASVINESKKPVLICTMDGKAVADARKYFEEHGVATFETPERAATALAALTRASLIKSPQPRKPHVAASHNLIKKALQEGRNLLEPEAMEFLRDNGIPGALSHLAQSEEQAIAAARAVGGPVVLKIVSPQVIHKSDVGGVKVNIQGDEAVGNAYCQILANVKQAVPRAAIEGVLVAPLAQEGTELIVGVFRDPQFGPVVMVGLGGVFVEVLKDVSFRVAPFGIEVARDMISETKAASILAGVRGQKPADIEALAELLVKISELAERYDDIREIDLNPVRVYPQGLAILDCRIMLNLAESGAAATAAH